MGTRHRLMAACLLGLYSGVSSAADAAAPAIGAPGEPAAAAPAQAPAASGGPVVAERDTASDLDKVNYSLGYELGEDLRRLNLEARPESLMRGVEDALSGARPAVKPSERREALGAIETRRATENLERSRAFLAENAGKDGVKTLPSGLQYREIQGGEGATPQASDRVSVNYRGRLIDGTEFDSSYRRGKPSTFQVRRVIPGWREALQLMREGAKWELYVPPELAYGERSPSRWIPPNSALIFEVELLSVEQGPAPPPRPSARTRELIPEDD